MRNLVILFLVFFGCKISFAQQVFTVDIEEITIPNFPALHSGAHAELDNKWIFIGGRNNGLHGFQTANSFPFYGINNTIYVLDFETMDVFSYSCDSLSADVREAITSSNMQFYQDGNTLYMQGGYGWKESAQEYITFPTLTAIDLQGLVDAVMNGTNITSFFRMITDEQFAITGAHLQKLNNQFHIVFGHRFDGTYSHNQTGNFFTQTYSNSIRSFSINDDGTNLSVSDFSENIDTNNFHRRDYNLVPQIFPNREEGLTAFSGVFQKGIDIPYFTTIDINSGGATHVPGFNQNLSQYHSAVVPLYDYNGNTMHSLFFGGMSMYKLDGIMGELLVDSLVPFVNTISKVTRTAENTLMEFQLPVTMPALLGSNAHFIALDSIEKYANGVIKLNSITGRTLIGHIVGGIESPEDNISETDPTVSIASARVFEVYIETEPDAVHEILVKEPVQLAVYPNPANDFITVEINAAEKENVEVMLLNAHGMVVEKYLSQKSFSGSKKLTKNIASLPAGLYYVALQTDKFSRAQRLIVK
ncbi:MAG: T9SS type A sorting domain-containing protein [Bacteroidia bacterium]